MMHLQRNFYEVLGLSPAATADDIKKRYRELARKFHPDLVEDKVLGQRIFTQINQAYRTLSDPDRRSQYDASLRAPRPKQTGSASTVIREPGPIAGASGAAQRATRPTIDIEGLLRQADRAMMQGNSTEAQSLCEKILKEEPESAPAYSILGDALAQVHKNTEAIAAYRKSL
ncbi:MAG: DnaJ domain-containing protein, partial [Capsulimonadaceae bacterium]